MSTIEGGMICTDDDELANVIRSIRSHGWDRDLSQQKQSELRQEYDVNDFQALYTFYWEGYNLRATDLQAKIGLSQINKLDDIIENRKNNFSIYQNLVNNDFWKPDVVDENISNFAYPIITPNREELVLKLREKNIECRPLVCGSIGRQPFWKRKYEVKLKNADLLNDFGLYVPNHHSLSEQNVITIAQTINEVTNNKTMEVI